MRGRGRASHDHQAVGKLILWTAKLRVRYNLDVRDNLGQSKPSRTSESIFIVKHLFAFEGLRNKVTAKGVKA
jgi:hypothetical protein